MRMKKANGWVAFAFLGAGAAGLSGCQNVHADATPPPGKVVAVVVKIASATLAEDCAPPPSANAKQRSEDVDVNDQSSSKGRPVGRLRRSCRQTSVQLGLSASADGTPTTFAIVKAQLFDADGKALLQDMSTRNPRVWDANGVYQAWDGAVKPKQNLQVSYDMNEPNWSKMGGSQQAAQGKSFRLVLTVRVAGKDTRVESTVKSAEVDHRTPHHDVTAT